MTALSDARIYLSPRQKQQILVLLTVLSSAVVVGLAAGHRPALTIGALLLLPLGLAILSWPDTATLLVIFVLFTNAAVVAVQFHGVPFAVGASVPVLLGLPLVHMLFVQHKPIVITNVLPLLIAYLAVQIFGAAFAQDTRATLSDLITFAVEGFGLYFLITNVVRTPKMLRRSVWVLLLAGGLLGALSLFQQVTHTYGNNYWGFAQVSNAAFETGAETLQGAVEQPRLAGPMGQQNRYAQVMLMLIPLGLFQFWGEKSAVLRVLALLATALIAVGIALTFSRGAAVGFALMIILMTAMRYIKLYQFAIIVIGVVILMLAVPQYGARLQSLQSLTGVVAPEDTAGLASADGSVRSRLTEMLAATLVFVDHPIIGVGPGQFGEYYQEYATRVGIRVVEGNRAAHSLYPGVAAENGVLGLLCLLGIVFLVLRDLDRARRQWMQRRPEQAYLATGFMLAVVSYMTTGLFLHFAYIRYFWLIMALASVAGMSIHDDTPPVANDYHLASVPSGKNEL